MDGENWTPERPKLRCLDAAVRLGFAVMGGLSLCGVVLGRGLTLVAPDGCAGKVRGHARFARRSRR